MTNITEAELTKLWGDSPTPEDLEDPMKVKIYSPSRKTVYNAPPRKWWQISRSRPKCHYDLYYKKESAVNEIRAIPTNMDAAGNKWIPVMPILEASLISWIERASSEADVTEINLIDSDGKVAKVIKLK